jgi:hypothetical protein
LSAGALLLAGNKEDPDNICCCGQPYDPFMRRQVLCRECRRWYDIKCITPLESVSLKPFTDKIAHHITDLPAKRGYSWTLAKDPDEEFESDDHDDRQGVNIWNPDTERHYLDYDDFPDPDKEIPLDAQHWWAVGWFRLLQLCLQLKRIKTQLPPQWWNTILDDGKIVIGGWWSKDEKRRASYAHHLIHFLKSEPAGAQYWCPNGHKI